MLLKEQCEQRREVYSAGLHSLKDRQPHEVNSKQVPRETVRDEAGKESWGLEPDHGGFECQDERDGLREVVSPRESYMGPTEGVP